MTKKIFWANPYQTELEAQVTSVTDQGLTLSETIFYALSGGQESDHGTIGGFMVAEAHKVDHEIFYKLEGAHHLKTGDRVKVQIDWSRRYNLMKLHFAAELVLELVYKKLGDIAKLGAHIGAEKARIDFQLPESISKILPDIQNEANAIIASNLDIISDFSDEQSERRFWKIEGFSQVPCGGTHLKKTGEIGPIRLKRDNKGKGKERVEIFLTQ